MSFNPGGSALAAHLHAHGWVVGVTNAAIAYVLQYLVMPVSYVGVTFLGVQSKLYSMALMYSLTAKEEVGDDGELTSGWN